MFRGAPWDDKWQFLFQIRLITCILLRYLLLFVAILSINYKVLNLCHIHSINGSSVCYVWARFANAGYLLDSRNTFFCTKQRTHSVINILLFMQQMIFSIRSLHDDLNGGSLDSLCLDNSGFVEDCIIYLKERLMNDSLLIIMIYVLIMSRTSYIINN